jgi:hypothetical protein
MSAATTVPTTQREPEFVVARDARRKHGHETNINKGGQHEHQRRER